MFSPRLWSVHLEHVDDLARGTLHVRRQWNTKAHAITDLEADSAGSITIVRFLLPDLVAHLEAFTGPKSTSTVLRGRRGDERVSKTAFDVAWRKARQDVRPTFHFHDLRHTGLTVYAPAGRDACRAAPPRRAQRRECCVAVPARHCRAGSSPDRQAQRRCLGVIGPARDYRR